LTSSILLLTSISLVDWYLVLECIITGVTLRGLAGLTLFAQPVHLAQVEEFREMLRYEQVRPVVGIEVVLRDPAIFVQLVEELPRVIALADTLRVIQLQAQRAHELL
jgi:hypothetical protein